MLSLLAASAAADPIQWAELGLRPGIDFGGYFTLRFYSLAYLIGVIFAYWHTSKMLKKPGAPMAQRHADDLVHVVVAVGRETAHEAHVGDRLGPGRISLVERRCLGRRDRVIGLLARSEVVGILRVGLGADFLTLRRPQVCSC